MNKSCGVLFLLALLVTACLGIFYMIFFVIPSQVTKSFGSPNSALSPVQRLRYAVELYVNKNELFAPNDLNQTDLVDFDIETGEAVSSISGRLEEIGLIPDAALFTHLLIYTGLDTSIQSGRFALSPAKSPVETAVTLTNPDEVRIPFAVLPGWRMEEVAATIDTYQFGFSGEDFLAAAREPLSIGVTIPIDGGKSLEGMIRTGITYVKKNVELRDFIISLSISSSYEFTSEMQAALEAKGMNVYQALILASIVKREAVQPSEMKMIASVFFNRLQQGMKLESDPTVQYAVGFDPITGSWWKTPLTYDDLRVNSPYNTYLFGGLPPTPISNPGQEALDAVAFPEITDYIFFRARCDNSGYHNFAKTYEEHLNNSCN